ncbi:MAG: serine/threonine-protein kinase, partial [Anaerolineales bacterium]
MDLQPGQPLGQYRITQKIGEGGMGAVYKADQPSVPRAVVIKVLSASFAEYADAGERFQRELKMIARLEHPHILPVYDYGESDGLLYIVMRYLPGGTLKTRLDAGRLSLHETNRILSQLAAALDYAHKRGVVHRDIKPANILIDAQGDVFLTDFGIAKIAEGTLDLTGTALIGTPQY